MGDTTASSSAALRDARKEMLARLLAAEGLGATGGTIPPRDPGATPPASFAQEVVWLLDRVTPGLIAYNSAVAFRLQGRIDAAALARAMDLLVARHEALRTRFAAEGERAVQHVDAVGRAELRLLDVRALPPAERAAAARSALAEVVSTAFDLERDHLFRPVLVQVDDDEWYLLLLAHHIVCDAWSFGVMVHELSQLYAAALHGREATLPPPRLQFADVAAWERAQMQGDWLRDRLSYWREVLASAPAALSIPTDRPRHSAPSFAGAEVSLLLPQSAVDRLKQLAADNGATLYMVLLASYQTLLHRWSGEDDVVTGSAIAGRTRSETEGVIGYFSGALPLRTRFTDGESFRSLLARVRSTVLGALEHQDVPVEALTRELQEQGRSGEAGLFQAVLTMQETQGHTLVLEGATVSQLPIPAVATKFDLTLLPTERPGGLELLLWYRTELFDQATADRLLGQLSMLLSSVAADPDQPVDTIPLLTAEEVGQVGSWNATARSLGPAATMSELTQAASLRWPDATAVVAGSEMMSWDELRQRAARVAHALQARGATPGSVVGLALDRSVDLVVGMLGILWSGAAYVPLLPELPVARLQQQLRASGARCVLTTQTHRDRFAEDLDLLCLDREAAYLATLPSSPPACAATPASLAYVLFTSGSTGVPKGVAVTHANLVHYTRAIAERLGLDLGNLDERQRWHAASVSTLAADLGHTSVFPMLASGGTLHLLTDGATLDPLQFQDYLRRHPLDLLKITPSHLHALLGGDMAPEHLPARWLVLGGEACPRSVAQDLLAAARCRILNHYGPTETTVGATTFEVDRTLVSAGPSGTVPIGRPLANVTTHVLDRQRSEVGVGVPGELWIGGAGVAAGYFGDEELTAERFVTIDGERRYRTGDRVRRLMTGDLEFLGRLDNQVKIRGHRVELAEIESALVGNPAVQHAAVLFEGDSLTACVVARDSVTDLELVRWLGTLLPDHMVPAHWVRLAQLPLTPNGKVDRAALAALRADAPTGNVADGAPEGETEIRIATIWAEVLKRPRIGRAENFFALGGNSLLAIRLLGRIAKQFGVRLPLRTLFEHPTIAELAVALRPTHALEAPLVAIWSEVLKRPDVKADDNFFALGGNSLLAIRLLGRVSKEFGVRLPLRLLFEHPTVAQLAPALEAARTVVGG